MSKSKTIIEGDGLPFRKCVDMQAKEVEVIIRRNGSVLWVNDERGCILRICQLKKLNLIDERPIKALSKDKALELFRWLDYEYNITEGYETLSEIRRSNIIAERKFAEALFAFGLDLDDLHKVTPMRIGSSKKKEG